MSTPFKSGVTNYTEIKKRLDEMGIRPVYHSEEIVGVDVTPKPAPEPTEDASYPWY